MSVRTYIPNTIADQLAWIDNFGSYVEDNFAPLGLGSSDNDAIQASVAAYDAAYAASQLAGTRTPVTIAAFVAQQTSTLTLLRSYAQIINNNASTSDEQRAALQITIRKTTKTKITAPVTWPVLTILAALPLQHKMQFRDSSAPTIKVRARPFGAIAMQLFMYVGATPPASPDLATFVGNFTRNPQYVDLPADKVGQTAYYYAQWVTARGLTGPLVAGPSMTIAA